MHGSARACPASGRLISGAPEGQPPRFLRHKVLAMIKANKAHDQVFHERLSRIHSGAPKTVTRPPAGADDAPQPQESWVRAVLVDLLVSPVGLAAGIGAILGARIAAMKLFAPDGYYPLVLDPPVVFMGIELALALILMIVLMLVLDLNRGLRRSIVFIGFLGAILAEEALLDIAPDALRDNYPADMIRDAIIES